MEKGLFHDLYKRLEELDVRSYPPGQLSGLLDGYWTVYSMVRVYRFLFCSLSCSSCLVTRLLDGVLDGTGIPVVGE